MFGYIRPRTNELRIREYECYRAYYCGLCRSMGSCTGQCSRMTLSYDFVFLAAVRCYLTGEAPKFQKIRCLAHPFRRRRAVIDSKQLDYCADASALLSYQKCRDDRLDEKGFRRLRAGIAMLLLSRAYKKAKKRHPALDQKIAAKLDRLHAYERSDAPPSADEPAAIFGELMRAVFAEGLDGTAARLASEIGYHVGKWIYLTDAADDLEADRKHRRFNPYLRLFDGKMGEHERSNVRLALTAILCDAERAFLLMENAPCPEIHEILANILYLGLPDAADRALDPEPKKKQKKTEKELSDE